MDADNCQELLAGADMLGLSLLLEQCCDFLHHQLDATNALGKSANQRVTIEPRT